MGYTHSKHIHIKVEYEKTTGVNRLGSWTTKCKYTPDTWHHLVHSTNKVINMYRDTQDHNISVTVRLVNPYNDTLVLRKTTTLSDRQFEEFLDDLARIFY